jgi:TP901 family phage tail tape measure protein
MAEGTGIISSKVIIDVSETDTKIRSLAGQLGALRTAYDRAFQSDNNTTIFKNESISAVELKAKIEEVSRSLLIMKTEMNKGTLQDTSLTNEVKQLENVAKAAEEAAIKLEKTKAKMQAINDNFRSDGTNAQNKIDASWEKEKAAWRPDRSVVDPGNVAQLKEQMTPQSYVNLQSKIRGAADEAEKLYLIQNKRGSSDKDVANYNNAQASLKSLVATQEGYNTSIGKTNSMLDGMGRRIKSHLEWIFSGALIMGALGIPTAVIEGFTKLESAMAGVRQVLPSIEHDQSAANAELQKFVSIGSQYGETVEQIVEAGRSWGRMYKDVDTVNLLVSQSAKMATADNFSLTDSVKGLESAMAQFGMKSQDINEIQVNSNRILDVWTKLSHSAGVSAQDLTQAVERAGSAAHQTGVSFEFFNSLVAAGVRNTARSGAEIGQTLKSVFSSMHSEKTQKELADMGIAVKQVGADGTQSFRAVQDVLLEVALKTQSTTKDINAMNLAISGGKFQWSKASAIFGDYQEILKNWEMSVNAAGFTNEQVAVQMSTLARQTKALKAEMDGLFSGVGNAGVGNFLKEITSSMTDFTRGMKESSSNVLALFVSMTRLASAFIIVKAAVTGYGFVQGVLAANTMLANGAEVESIALDAIKITSTAGVVGGIRAQAVAQGMLAASTRALTGISAVGAVLMGNLPAILALVAYGIYSVVSAQGEASRAQDIKNGKSVEENDLLLKQIEVGKQRVQFIDTLVTQYNTLSKSIDDNSESTVENARRQAEQKTILEILQRQTGLSTEELVKDGVIQVETINNIKNKNKEEAEAKLKENIAKMTAEYEGTQQFILNTQTRIDGMTAELTNVGILGKAYQWLMSIMAQKQLAAADELDKYAKGEVNTSDYATDVGASGQFTEGWVPNESQQNSAKSQAQSIRESGNDLLSKSGQTGIDVLKGQMVQAIGVAQNLSDTIVSTQGQLNAIERGEDTKPPGTVDPPNKKEKKGPGDKTNGGVPPEDPSKKIERDAYKDNVTIALHKEKLATDAYAESIDALNAKEDVYGKTVSTTIERLNIMKNRRQELNDQEWASNSMAEKLGKELDDKIGNSDELLSSFGVPSKEEWDKMDKVTKAGLKIQKRDIMDAHADIKAETAAFYSWEDDASKARREGTKLDREITKDTSGGTGDDTKQSSRRMSNISDNESIAISKATNQLDMQSELKIADIKHQALLDKQKEFLVEMARLQKEYDDAVRNKIPLKIQETADALKKEQVANASNDAAILKSNQDKNLKIHEGEYAVVDDLLLKGNKARDIFKNLMNQMAEDALKALMRIPNGGGSWITQLLGGNSGGSSAKLTGSYSTGVNTDWLGTAASIIPKFFADGGIVDKPTYGIFGEDGIETNINIDKLSKGDSRQQGLLAYANSQSKGTQVTANVSQKTLQTAQQISDTQRINNVNAAHLQTLIGLTTQQNTMINYLINNPSKSGTTVAQPMVFSTQQGNDQLQSQLDTMRKQGYKG